ncbi:hypothetical protein Esti_004005 [Eimeria stiedai]
MMLRSQSSSSSGGGSSSSPSVTFAADFMRCCCCRGRPKWASLASFLPAASLSELRDYVAHMYEEQQAAQTAGALGLLRLCLEEPSREALLEDASLTRLLLRLLQEQQQHLTSSSSSSKKASSKSLFLSLLVSMPLLLSSTNSRGRNILNSCAVGEALLDFLKNIGAAAVARQQAQQQQQQQQQQQIQRQTSSGQSEEEQQQQQQQHHQQQQQQGDPLLQLPLQDLEASKPANQQPHSLAVVSKRDTGGEGLKRLLLVLLQTIRNLCDDEHVEGDLSQHGLAVAVLQLLPLQQQQLQQASLELLLQLAAYELVGVLCHDEEAQRQFLKGGLLVSLSKLSQRPAHKKVVGETAALLTQQQEGRVALGFCPPLVVLMAEVFFSSGSSGHCGSGLANVCLHPAGAALLLQQQDVVLQLLRVATGEVPIAGGGPEGLVTAASTRWRDTAARVLYRLTALGGACVSDFAATVACSRPDWAFRVVAAAAAAAAAAAEAEALPELFGLLVNCKEVLPLQQLLEDGLLQLTLRLLCAPNTLPETRLELWRLVAAAAADAAAAPLLREQLLLQLLQQDVQRQQAYYQRKLPSLATRQQQPQQQPQQQQQQQQCECPRRQQRQQQLLLNKMLLHLFCVVEALTASEATR